MFILLLGILTFANFQEANEYYKNSKYEKALEEYLELKPNSTDYILNYNIANSYYRLGKMGLAKAYYLKVLKYKPRDSDAVHNLTLLNSKLNQAQPTILEKISHFFDLNELAFINLVLFIFTLFLIFIFIKRFKAKKSVLFVSFVTVNLFLIYAIVFIITVFSYKDFNKEKIVIIEASTLLSAPSASSLPLTKLNEGIVLEKLYCEDVWCKVILEDKYIGWIDKEKLLEI